MSLYKGRYQIKTFFFKYFNLTAKNVGIVFIATSIVNLINFFYHMTMARLLGPSEYGILTSIISILFITGTIVGAISIAVTKYTSIYHAEENTGKIRTFFLSTTKGMLISTIIVFIIIMIFKNKIASFLNLELTYSIIFLGVILIEGSIISIGRGVLQGMNKFRSLGINVILEVVLKISLGVILVLLGFKASGAIFGFLLATLISYFFIFPSLRKILSRGETSKNIDRIDIKKIYKSTFFILISTILLSLISYTDIVLVKHFFTSYETGYYSAAAQIGRIILFFPGAVGIVVFPRLTEKITKNENPKSTLLKSFLIILIVSSIFLIAYFFFPELITRIIYGNEYLSTSNLIFKYGIFMTFISLINLQVFYFISIGKYWYLINIFLVLIGQIILIWIYHSNLYIILLILIINSFIVFIINNLIIFTKKIIKE